MLFISCSLPEIEYFKNTPPPLQIEWWSPKFNDQFSFNFLLNPLTAGAEYIGFFTQLLTHSVPPFKHVKGAGFL